MIKSVLLTGSAIVLLSSCYSYKVISGNPEYDKYKMHRSVHVLKASTNTDTLYFSEKMPANMGENAITGLYQKPFFKEPDDSVVFKPYKYKALIDYIIKDGIRYDVFTEKNQLFIYNKDMPVNIPYTNLESAYIKIFHRGSTAFLVGSTSATLLTLLTLFVVNMEMDFNLTW
jgi:hypothetical protein